MKFRNIDLPQDRITAFCQKWKVVELALFGSVLRDDFRPDSDIDILISFRPDAPWSLWNLFDMRQQLQEIFGMEVDLIEKEALRNPFRKNEILNNNEVVYAA